jgi:hypothetical protein
VCLTLFPVPIRKDSSPPRGAAAAAAAVAAMHAVLKGIESISQRLSVGSIPRRRFRGEQGKPLTTHVCFVLWGSSRRDVFTFFWSGTTKVSHQGSPLRRTFIICFCASRQNARRRNFQWNQNMWAPQPSQAKPSAKTTRRTYQNIYARAVDLNYNG